MSQSPDAAPPPADTHDTTSRITVDLAAELSPQELEAFLDRARAAGRTPEEHFLAITIGKPASAA